MAGQRRRSEDLIVETLCPEGIPDAEYRRLLFERAGLRQQDPVIGARDDGVCYINLYFRGGTAPAWRICRGCAPPLIALSRRHRELRCSGRTGMHRGRELGFGVFTERSRWPACGAAIPPSRWGASWALPATVVTYKNRIFKKCQVASLKEFLLKADAVASGTGTDRPFLLIAMGGPARRRWRPQRATGKPPGVRRDGTSAARARSTASSGAARTGMEAVATEAACRNESAAQQQERWSSRKWRPASARSAHRPGTGARCGRKCGR